MQHCCPCLLAHSLPAGVTLQHIWSGHQENDQTFAYNYPEVKTACATASSALSTTNSSQQTANTPYKALLQPILEVCRQQQRPLFINVCNDYDQSRECACLLTACESATDCCPWYLNFKFKCATHYVVCRESDLITHTSALLQ